MARWSILATQNKHGYEYDSRDTQQRHGHAVNLLGFTVAPNGEIMEFNYKHLAPESYPVDMTEQVNARIRPMPANGYDIGWTTLTQADLSAGEKGRSAKTE